MNFVEENREFYEPFMDEDESFDAYLSRLRKDGEWGGQIELQALSLCLKINIIVHQLDQPRWEILNHPREAKAIHLSYHDGEHYNSVRLLTDLGKGPAQEIPMGSNGEILIGSKAQALLDEADSKEKMIMGSSGCWDLARVREVLKMLSGDVDAAILQLMTEVQETEVESTPEAASAAAATPAPSPATTPTDSKEDPTTPSPAPPKQKEETKGETKAPEIRRNDKCPCGSGKRYRKCCLHRDKRK